MSELESTLPYPPIYKDKKIVIFSDWFVWPLWPWFTLLILE